MKLYRITIFLRGGEDVEFAVWANDSEGALWMGMCAVKTYPSAVSFEVKNLKCKNMFQKKQWECKNCGHIGKKKTYTKGSFVVELFLWLMFLLPGVLYSLWRLSSKYEGCEDCGYTFLIPYKK